MIGKAETNVRILGYEVHVRIKPKTA